MVPEAAARSQVQAVSRALAILQAFGTERAEMGLTEIARAVGLHKTTVSRLVSTLVAEGFLDGGAEVGRYRMGLRAFEIGAIYIHHNSLEREAHAYLRELAEGTGQAVYLGMLDRQQVVYMDVVEGRGAVKVQVNMGQRTFCHSTAAGKVLLAELPDPDVLQLLKQAGMPRLTAQTITSPAGLCEQLRLVRQRGYALVLEEHLRGVGSVGAPIRQDQGPAPMAVSLAFPTGGVDEADIQSLIQAVCETAEKITRRVSARNRFNGSAA